MFSVHLHTSDQNPTVVMAASERAGDSDDSVELSCTVSSKPAPTKLEWFFGETKVANQPTSTASGYARSSQYTVSNSNPFTFTFSFNFTFTFTFNSTFQTI